MVNLYDLLKKYITLVAEEEGTDYLHMATKEDFSDEELLFLTKLSREAYYDRKA